MEKWIPLLLIFFLPLLPAEAQVSHGGKPLPLSLLRSLDEDFFEEMPSFDVAEELRLDSLNESDLRSGYRFAYKFMTAYTQGNSGVSFTLPDGTKVWRLGIRSKGALSLNVLFTEYELPEGAQLFLYNADQTQILGAFNHLNNSDLHLLPVAPIRGEELIIEYQEPARAAFQGRLTVGEVNHGYRNLRGEEPRDDQTNFACMPSLACLRQETNVYDPIGRSVVMMLIDGSIACTGVLVNNTDSDGTPYVLTASHCLNNQFKVTNPDYEKVAGSIVFFFNYDSPLCDPVVRGTEEMSVASARYKAVNERNDMALLELAEMPPVYYSPYYAGWNAGNTHFPPYKGIHHPGGSVKRINESMEPVVLESFTIPDAEFYKNAHWKISQWDTGCTAAGSSGSPLFDSFGRVIGGLSGGSSTCANPMNDYYYALSAAWHPSDEPDEQLECWLNPGPVKTLVCDGLDPYASSPCLRLSNVYATGKSELVESALFPGSESEPLFGNRSDEVNEYAEAYTFQGTARLYGAYFVTPSAGSRYKDLEVWIQVYSGENQPETLLHSERFQPSYCNKVVFNDTFQQTPKPLDRAQESYVHFTEPVDVDHHFYIAYQIRKAPENTFFSVYNLPRGEITKNTVWLKNKTRWIKATDDPSIAFNTSLFIDPVIQYTTPSGTSEIIGFPQEIQIYRNPESHLIHILLPETVSRAELTLLSIDGKILRKESVTPPQTVLSQGNYPAGIYLLQIAYAGKRYAQKVVF